MNKLSSTLIAVALTAVVSAAPCADVMNDILDGVYDAQTLSAYQQDSILGNLPDRRYRLDYTDKQQIYRRSFMANYVIVDTQKNTRKPLSDKPVRDAIISPNGRYIAFVKADNNIYLHKLDFGTEVAVTASPSTVWNGIADWLYEEEFGRTCLMQFSPDSKQLAFIRLDDQDVPSTSWQMMLPDGHPQTVTQSYPRAGEHNAKPSVQIYTISNKDIREASLPEADDRYIPRICWRTLPAAKKDQEPVQQLAILTLNRDQNKMEVFTCNPASLVCTSLYEESSNDYYVDYSLFDDWQWLNDGRFIVLSEKSDWKQAYMHAPNGRQTALLTDNKCDITAMYGFDEATQTLYYQAATTPHERVCFALNTKKNTLSVIGEQHGWNSMYLSKDYKQAILAHESDQRPVVYSKCVLKTGNIETILDLINVFKQWRDLQLPAKQFVTIPISTPQGDAKLNGCIFYPRDFDQSKKYPVVMLQYSGPASQRVTDRWRRRWDYGLADLGYVVVIADPRGTDAQGRAYRNYAYMRMGREADDQLAVAKWISDQSWADNHKIYMAGWSYGGYEVLRCLCTQPLQDDGTPLIAKGIAIAPVTDWRLYDSGYTERFMRRPQVNEGGYNDADLTHLAAGLKGELLIVHGNADDNVHVQNTWRMVEALINADKDYQMLVYPDDNHFLKKGNHYKHLHKQLIKFLEK
ncbi:MAG: DPP IV N-terminal domain-containing protein [Paludibacteraceae bacterium]|nr:DPP IV N-terminal domain-containing protein [Paludibacteraceae bacterium]